MVGADLGTSQRGCLTAPGASMTRSARATSPIRSSGSSSSGAPGDASQSAGAAGYHEAGHAIVACSRPARTRCARSRSSAWPRAGVTFSAPDDDRFNISSPDRGEDPGRARWPRRRGGRLGEIKHGAESESTAHRPSPGRWSAAGMSESVGPVGAASARRLVPGVAKSRPAQNLARTSPPDVGTVMSRWWRCSREPRPSRRLATRCSAQDARRDDAYDAAGVPAGGAGPEEIAGRAPELRAQPNVKT